VRLQISAALQFHLAVFLARLKSFARHADTIATQGSLCRHPIGTFTIPARLAAELASMHKIGDGMRSLVTGQLLATPSKILLVAAGFPQSSHLAEAADDFSRAPLLHLLH
jgi:hypothetical protein